MISQTVTLQGGGQVAMSNSALNQIFASAASNTLVNVDNTVSGAGTIGGGTNMVLVNQTKGIINANQTTALTVRTDANIITNTGTMRAPAPEAWCYGTPPSTTRAAPSSWAPERLSTCKAPTSRAAS